MVFFVAMGRAVPLRTADPIMVDCVITSLIAKLTEVLLKSHAILLNTSELWE